MSEDKLLVTDLIKEVGNQALSLVKCEPFIRWVLERVPIVIEHDASAILLTDNVKAKFYLWLNQTLSEDYIREIRFKVIEAFNASAKSNLPERDFETITYEAGEIHKERIEVEGSMASFYCIPLVARENILGVFAISSRKPGLFLVYRLNLFNVFANQVALAIDSLKAREQVVKQARIIERDSFNMKTAFSGMSEGLIMTDESDQIILLNPVAKKMLGLKEEGSQDIPNDFISSVFSPILKELAANDKRLVSKEVGLEKPQKITLRIDAAPVRDSEGRRIGTVILLRDITAEKEIDKLKSEFISAVSHELRTPLTTIRESVSQVLDGILGQTTPKQREFLSVCLEDIDRLTRIINDLLDMSKIEAKMVEIKRELADIVGLVKTVSSSFIPRTKEKGLEIRTSFSKERIEVYIDRDKIIRVFTNLVGNSLKFTEKGYIEILIVDKQDTVECSVFDIGRGISEEDLPKVFSKFQQFGRTVGPGEKGTGLGLAIAKGIVELHRGKIWVESKFNEWTKFTFTLPKYSTEEIIYENIEKRIVEAKREDKEFSVLIIKLDNYLEIKDEFGEERTQRALLKILEIFKNAIRIGDFITSKGKDELIVLAEVSRQCALEMNERFKTALKESVVEIDNKELKVNFSYGCSTYPDDGDNAKDLLQKAYEILASER